MSNRVNSKAVEERGLLDSSDWIVHYYCSKSLGLLNFFNHRLQNVRLYITDRALTVTSRRNQMSVSGIW